MPSPTGSQDRRRGIVVAVGIVAVLAALTFGYVTLIGGTTGRSTVSPAGAASLSGDESRARVQMIDGALVPLAESTDPQEFARVVADALFAWDTTLGINVEDYLARLVEVADPLGESTPGLVADLAGYLPSRQTWLQLRGYSTRQWLTITSIRVPTLWDQALAEAGPDGLLAGTTAYTIKGIRHRAGIWEETPVASRHQVAFTIFLVCAPAYPECHLLRLSRLDEPLD